MAENPFDAATLTAMMDSEGPIVDLLLCDHAGNIVEMKNVDMTPRLHALGDLLGGTQLTFIGQMQDLVFVRLLEADQLQTNTYAFPGALAENTGTFKGKFVVIRMDDNAIPQSVSLEEYLRCCRETEEGFFTGDASDDVDDDDDGDGDGDVCEEEDDDSDSDYDVVHDMLVDELSRRFADENGGREASNEYLQHMIDAMVENGTFDAAYTRLAAIFEDGDHEDSD
jgi:hypothetical protein